MEEKKVNVLLFIVLAILMIVAIVIVIINPNKTENITEIYSENLEEIDESQQQVKENLQLINKEEEQRNSMQIGGIFCKYDDKVVFYEESNETLYYNDLNNNVTNKIAKLTKGAYKIYFDGEYIYYIPYYYRGKGIYKIDLQGNITCISQEASLQLWITENKIYFVKQIGFDDFNQNPQGTICVMDKDGNNIKEIAKNIKNNFYIQNDKIFYTTQDRKMYQINIDGTNQKNITDGRKFVIALTDKYLIYIDYANQEAEHLYNLETNEDKIVGYFGQIKNYQGKIYLNVRKKSEDGSIQEEFALLEISENANVKEIGQIANFGTDIKYITNNVAYLYNQQEGIYTIGLNDKTKEKDEKYKDCKFFIGGSGYKIDTSDIDNIKVEKIEL